MMAVQPKNNGEQARIKAQRVLETLLAQYPEYTGNVQLNFHRGNLSEKVKVEYVLPFKTE